MRWTRGRSEISLLVLCALLLLSMLSIFQLYFYRSTVLLSVSEQREQLSGVARELASRLANDTWPASSADLTRWATRWAPGVEGVRILDADGRTLMSSLVSRGMIWERQSALVENADFRYRGDTYRVEVQRLAPTILAQQRSLGILTPLVLTVNLGVLWLVVASIRRWLKPIDMLLHRARELGHALEPRDEVAFILRTFESSLVEMAGSEHELRALEGALVRSMDSGVLLLDAGGRVLVLNPVGAKILQLPSFETPGNKLDEVLAPHPPLVTLIQQAIAGEVTVQRRELEIGSEQRRILGLTVHAMRQDDGHIQGWLVMFADLTQVKKQLADERLAESLRHLGELTAGVAHEMRNGLATLKGYIELIERGGTREVIDTYLAELRLETEHLHRVVEDFLSFARPGTVRLEEIDLEALVRRVAKVPAEEVEIDVDVSGWSAGDGAVRGDPVLLTRALTNVVKNALQAQAAGSSEDNVRIILTTNPSGASVTVADRGPGIARGIRDRLFEAFASARPSGGVGLGLALTRRIVTLHGGSITLVDRPGGGALAEIQLPFGKTVTESIDASGPAADDLLRPAS